MDGNFPVNVTNHKQIPQTKLLLLGALPYHSKFVGREGTLSLRTILPIDPNESVDPHYIERSLMQKRRERTERGCAK